MDRGGGLGGKSVGGDAKVMDGREAPLLARVSEKEFKKETSQRPRLIRSKAQRWQLYLLVCSTQKRTDVWN